MIEFVDSAIEIIESPVNETIKIVDSNDYKVINDRNIYKPKTSGHSSDTIHLDIIPVTQQDIPSPSNTNNSNTLRKDHTLNIKDTDVVVNQKK
jgi:hypothetical protein